MSAKIKIISVVLLISIVGFLPASAFALGMEVPTADGNTGMNSISGLATNTGIVAAISGVAGANKACEAAEKGYFAGDKAVTFGFGGLSLISGGATVLAQIQTKLSAIEGFESCRLGVLTALDGIFTPNVFTANHKQTIYNSASAALAALKAREEPLKDQLRVVQQGFWKTLVYNILIKTTKTVANNLVYKLTDKFKVQDFARYADAVATQVYDNQFILKNYSGEKADQMLARSYLNSPALTSAIPRSVYVRANQSLGYDPKSLSYNDPNFYAKAAYMGSGQANPFLQDMMFADNAEQIHNRSLANAQMELNQSTGLKTPRNCSGTLKQQRDIDYRYTAVNKKLKDRQKLLQDLQDAKKIGKNVKDGDIELAEKDIAYAEKELQALPNDVGESPIIDICSAIVSPPSLVNKGIDEAFKSMGANLGTYNDNNLPFFINFITDVANQITNKMIFGGGISASNLINENAGNIAKAGALGLGFASSNKKTEQSSNLVVTVGQVDDGKGQNATLEINWDATTVGNAKSVMVTGPGIPVKYNGIMVAELDNALEATVPISGSYTYIVKAYGNSQADLKATVSITFTPKAVAGATIIRTSLNIRGPGEQSVISPRGEF